MEFSHTVDVRRSPAEVFAFLDDFANTPRWNTHCTQMEQTSPGPRVAGSKLRYAFNDNGRKGEMRGFVRDREDGRGFTMVFTDDALEVIIAFALTEAGSGTRLVHTVSVTPRSFLMKMIAPVFRGRTGKQIVEEVKRLKEIIEKEP